MKARCRTVAIVLLVLLAFGDPGGSLLPPGAVVGSVNAGERDGNDPEEMDEALLERVEVLEDLTDINADDFWRFAAIAEAARFCGTDRPTIFRGAQQIALQEAQGTLPTVSSSVGAVDLMGTACPDPLARKVVADVGDPSIEGVTVRNDGASEALVFLSFVDPGQPSKLIKAQLSPGDSFTYSGDPVVVVIVVVGVGVGIVVHVVLEIIAGAPQAVPPGGGACVTAPGGFLTCAACRGGCANVGESCQPQQSHRCNLLFDEPTSCLCQ